MTKSSVINDHTVVKLSPVQLWGIISTVATGIIAVMLFMRNLSDKQAEKDDKFKEKDHSIELEITKLNTKIMYMNAVIFGGVQVDKEWYRNQIHQLETEGMTFRGGNSKPTANHD